MSILIKGLKMPDCCWNCPCVDGEYGECNFLGKTIKCGNGRLADCPLVELPDHGDLIDREALKKSLIDEGETVGIDGFSIDGLTADDVCYAIEKASVVIPAERSEDA